jgi:hypothetical protein
MDVVIAQLPEMEKAYHAWPDRGNYPSGSSETPEPPAQRPHRIIFLANPRGKIEFLVTLRQDTFNGAGKSYAAWDSGVVVGDGHCPAAKRCWPG